MPIMTQVVRSLLLRKAVTFNIKVSHHRFSMGTIEETLAFRDKIQVELLKKENCILVDENDKITGSASKLDCHLLSNGPPLHRAFSVFLFNHKNELLLQRRAMSKITFPGYYTNTCCSHPQFNDHETDESGNLGIKRAAQRRMEYELGVTPEQFPISNIEFITRILYKSPCSDVFGEHEVDYVLFAKGDVNCNVNSNEISEIRYVSLQEIDEFVRYCRSENIPLTPWFELILNNFLKTWWKDIDCISKHFDHKNVLKF